MLAPCHDSEHSGPNIHCQCIGGVCVGKYLCLSRVDCALPWTTTFAANCAERMNYYSSMVLVFVGMKLVLALILVGPWLWGKMLGSSMAISRFIRRRKAVRQVQELENSMRGARRGVTLRAMQAHLAIAEQQSTTISWAKVFKASFMLLFIAYPGMQFGCCGVVGRLRVFPRLLNIFAACGGVCCQALLFSLCSCSVAWTSRECRTWRQT